MNEIKNIDNPFVERSIRIGELERIISNVEFNKTSRLSDIDLHLHTNYSDGYWTPTGLVLEAYKKGMKCIALTDHDGFVGVEEAFEAVQLVNEMTGHQINFIPGIEFSTNYYYGPDNKKTEVHILGYFPSKDYTEFGKYLARINTRTQAYMEAFQKNRVLRIYEMVTKFNTELAAVVPTLAKIKKLQDPIITGRTVKRGMRNSAAPGRLLTSTGIFEVYSLSQNDCIGEISDEAFSNEYIEALKSLCMDFNSAQYFLKEYFDKKEPSAKTGYIGLTENPQWAVSTILAMGGIPVLAHPAKYTHLTKELLDLLVPLGLKGVEVISDHFKDESLCHQTVELIESEYPSLVITIGSDCHGKSVDGVINYTPKNEMGMAKDFGLNLGEFYDNINDLLG
jgi:predicted metal-dependent phosphoesterase TrpH